ncbi:hypothetical protein EJP82_01125 [Paenibacillus anaericanus]|uniref:HTH LytTR-type domain-containing protein n=1 Tax=Paenibacillus anaericanus TaxID=170367 RepID=A0A433YFB0_9BACL|nr:LytTR family transcriptional regulator DNA-binding domain-containing protein [Paenibacillus anaericanus]RUT48574.1 hypothetical protein EJP82_01125 [Paenibacillus anaericanus]
MGCLTVTRDVQGKQGMFSLKVNDIIFLECNPKVKDSIFVHTKDNQYYMVGPLKYWVTVLNNSGYRFSVVDRSNALNVDEIVWLDKIYKVAYFDHQIDKNSKRCPIAFHRYKDVENELILVNPAISIA